MRQLRVLLARLRAIAPGRAADDDLREQITAHLDEAAEEYMRQGLSPADARRAARLDFGSVVVAEEASRDARGRWTQDLAADLGYGLRMLRRDPGFAAVALVSLAIGIGANSAIFSIVNSMLLRPRPFADPARMVELFVGDRRSPYETTSYPSYVELRDRNQVLSGLAGYGIQQFALGDANDVEWVWGETVTENYFDVIGVRPAHGRGFAADEARTGGAAAVIAHGLWQRRFSSDPALVGRTITLNGQTLTVIGIAPPEFTGMIRGLSSEVWVPAAAMPALEPAKGQGMLTSRFSRWLGLIGRLSPGTSIERARARFDLLTREMQANHPEEWKSTTARPGEVRELFVSVLSERDTRVHPAVGLSPFAIAALVMTVVNLLLLIACMNLAGMLLARAVVRRREIAIRLAMGAGRFRIVRQLLAESILMAMIAGAGGIVLAIWGLHLLIAFIPPLPEGIRVAFDIQLDWRVVIYTIVFSTVVGVLFGLAPALHSSRADVGAVLKDDSNAFAGGQRKSRLRAALVVVQVAVALLLLIAGGLVLRSLEKTRPTRLGFPSENVVVATLNLNPVKYGRARSQAFYRDFAERVSALPGVRSITFVDGLPGGFMNRTRRSTEIEGYQPAPGESLEIDAAFVGPHYFRNMNVPIVIGRDFDERDREGAPCAAAINEAFVRRYFAGVGSPLGKHLAKLEADGSAKQLCPVIAVVRDDGWQSLQETARPYYWLSLQQGYRTRVNALIQTENDPAGHIDSIRRTMRSLEPTMPVNDVQTLHAQFAAMAYPFRLLGVIMGGSGAMALLLATIGVFGIVAYSVAQRTRELGIRIALGAARATVLRLVLGEGMKLVAAGLTIGLLASFALTPVLTSAMFESDLLFGVGATDALTFAGVTIMLGGVALAACGIPALRATRINPIEALRCE